MVSILPFRPVEIDHEHFQKLKAQGAKIEWYKDSTENNPDEVARYRVNGLPCIVRKETETHHKD